VSAKGLRVFLVEDEPMIRILVTDMLGELGYIIAGEAGHLDQALQLAQSVEFDLAILDVNLKGRLITPVAELIRARELPIIFATGYGAEGLPEQFRDLSALQKPFQMEALAAMIDEVMGRRPS
jgi:DNA-binding response OmpR family regulator